ncbi:MAG TPA: hypothetical protein VMS30_00265 [Phycisphaerales bacterium]|nr:hypothetical protein [Phycisphaerales bacterium]
MFHRKALERLLRTANDCWHLATTLIDKEESIHIKTFDRPSLDRLVEVCKPMMNEYARIFEPSAGERQAMLHRIANHRLEVELHRAYGRLFQAAHSWFVDRTKLEQLETLQRIRANSAVPRMDSLMEFERSLEQLATMRAAQVA